MRKIKLKNIFVLDNLLSSETGDFIEEIVREHAQKQRVDYFCRNEYRPGSEKYNEVEKERAKILAYPDHDIKNIDTIQIVDNIGNDVITFDLCVYTYETTEYDYDMEQEYPITAKVHFLKNANTSFGYFQIYTSVADLFSKKSDLLYRLKKESEKQMYYDLKESYKDEYRKYFLLLEDEIIESLSQGYEVRIDQAQTGMFTYGPPFIEIKNSKGSQIYHLSLLDKILAIDYYWDDDRKVRFGDNYRFSRKSVIEEYEYAKDNLCEEEPNDKDWSSWKD